MKKIGGSAFGTVVLLVGIALVAYGYYEYNAARQSLSNVLGKVFTGQSEAETRAVILMVAGGAAAILGVLMALKGRRR